MQAAHGFADADCVSAYVIPCERQYFTDTAPRPEEQIKKHNLRGFSQRHCEAVEVVERPERLMHFVAADGSGAGGRVCRQTVVSAGEVQDGRQLPMQGVAVALAISLTKHFSLPGSHGGRCDLRDAKPPEARQDVFVDHREF